MWTAEVVKKRRVKGDLVVTLRFTSDTIGNDGEPRTVEHDYLPSSLPPPSTWLAEHAKREIDRLNALDDVEATIVVGPIEGVKPREMTEAEKAKTAYVALVMKRDWAGHIKAPQAEIDAIQREMDAAYKSEFVSEMGAVSAEVEEKK